MSRRAAGRKTFRFDINPVIGMGLALGLIGFGHVLEGGRMGSLVQGAAGMIVFGGTLGAVLISFSFSDLKQAIAALRHILFDPARPPEDVIAAIGRFAVKARKEGTMKLEDDVEQTDDAFLKRGLGLAVDGATPTTIRTMLEGESMSRFDAEEAPARVFESAGGYAPTVGILGAVLGLINVMENLSDPTKLGSGIAVAFVATVYGVGSANLIFLPIATKLRTIAAREARRREVIIEGILAIQEGLNPRLIDQKLRGLFAIEENSTTRLRGKAA